MPETPTALPLPPDEAARIRIRTDLATNLFVEAGAGAGKTRSLVERVVELVHQEVPITAIAAITFTEKAAAELRHRVRDALERSTDPSAQQAAADLDHAPIGTLHSFARRILGEFPIETGLPPGFRVLDALESDMNFDEEWEEFLDGLLDDPDPPAGIVNGGSEFVDLMEFDRLTIQRDLKEVAKAFRWNWDLVDARVDRTPPGPFDLDLAGLRAELYDLSATLTPPDDKQTDKLQQVRLFADRLTPEAGLLPMLQALQGAAESLAKCHRVGAKTKWKQHGGDGALDELREREAELGERLAERVEDVKSYRKQVIGAMCGRFVLDRTARRAEAGTLEFHDLLVRARQLLAGDRTVRSHLHNSYQRLLLDEFQDTDPIQLEIAVRITSAPDDPAHDTDWTALRPLPGRLFIVGDPKQSIYRFRRADIAQYLRTPAQIGAEVEHLSANFRSTAQVIDYTNELFGNLIHLIDDTQPAFQVLDACRREEGRGHGSVVVLGAELHTDLVGAGGGVADELRGREASDVVGSITTALAEGWPVYDKEGLRPCRPGDICILIPTRLSLPALERALRSAQLPYRAENSSIVYATSEIRSLLLALRAADDPTDELAVVESLRGPLYGCSDVELWEWKSAGGRWGIWSHPPEGYEHHPVAAALRHLASINSRLSTTGAADLLAALADERRLEDLALDGADSRDVWHRIRFVIDQARAWADAGGRGIRRYLQWAARQASEGQVAEAILPEEDRDAIRLMTVHASKGLEFPITVVTGLTTQPQSRKGVQVSWQADDWQLSGKGDDGSFADIRPLDELMSDAERRRLLYVACTRAVDHLVFSVHRARDDQKLRDLDDKRCTSAELLWRYGAGSPAAPADLRSFQIELFTPPATVASDDVDDIDSWRQERDDTLERAGRRTGIAATRLAEEVMARAERDLDDDPGLDKQPVNLDLPPWQRGRYGTSIGRAVHGTLQFCDLRDGSDIEPLAQSQCAAEGILTMTGLVSQLARSAITAPIVQQVLEGAPHWRELFVAAPVGDRVLEGYVDLLVRTPDGLVIVDYKTDRWSGPVQTAERVGRYRIQLAAYGAALQVALGEPVVGGILVRCRAGDTAEQIEITDWDAAIEAVEALTT